MSIPRALHSHPARLCSCKDLSEHRHPPPTPKPVPGQGRRRLEEGKGEPEQLQKPKIRDSLSTPFWVSYSEMGEAA